MGVGMGLLERTVYDPRSGHPVNDNVADYLVPTSAGVPNIGVAPAVTAAVYHATGVRVRALPVRIEDLLTART
jgi:xanthine dehydrogenase YagR molybdenum-binding subunit